jgi:hypothetical protein
MSLLTLVEERNDCLVIWPQAISNLDLENNLERRHDFPSESFDLSLIHLLTCFLRVSKEDSELVIKAVLLTGLDDFNCVSAPCESDALAILLWKVFVVIDWVPPDNYNIDCVHGSTLLDDVLKAAWSVSSRVLTKSLMCLGSPYPIEVESNEESVALS